MKRVWRYVASAPLTYGWLIILLATTIVAHSFDERRLDALLQARSTDLHHLATDPLRVLFSSLFWIDGWYWWPYLLVFTVFLAPAERWLGRLRWTTVGLVCHLGATYLSEGYLYWRIQDAVVPSRLIDARDIGPSYFIVGLIGVLAYRIPGKWRGVYIAAAVAIFGGALIVRPEFTPVGHLCALLIGLALYPLTSRRKTKAAA